jgi:hypothetical protein
LVCRFGPVAPGLQSLISTLVSFLAQSDPKIQNLAAKTSLPLGKFGAIGTTGKVAMPYAGRESAK